MSDYKKIAEEALRKAKLLKIPVKSRLVEGFLYPENMKERIHPTLVDELLSKKTSLGDHPIFPEGDEVSFEQKIIGDRFKEVVNRYKTNHDVRDIDVLNVLKIQVPLCNEIMNIEAEHTKELEALAIKMVKEEFDIPDEDIEFRVKLTDKISIEGTSKHPNPISYQMEFDSHEDIRTANEEVYKRRFINAMIQGSAKKCTHMYHMVDKELMSIDSRLVSRYSKLLSAADLSYYFIPKMNEQVNGGVVKIEYPTKDNPKTIITAEALVFPVLIHELVKGVMEVLSASGLPKKELGEFVISKADYLTAEPWDMRIGPALWGKFTDLLDSDDFKIKHHICCVTR